VGARVRLVKTGWDDALVYEREASDASRPAKPTGKNVVVEVEACGVCHRDLLDRGGRFPFIQLPITPGHEAVGRVVAVGEGVTDWRVGDRVGTMHRDSCGECAECRRGETSLCHGGAWAFGILADGGYARSLFAPESSLFRVPDGIAAPEAAVLHCTFGTAYRDLATLGRLAKGERVLVTGANGGVGAAAVQIASRLGAEVVGVVRSEKHVAFVRSLGATDVVVDDANAFHSKVGKVDVALDTVGQATFASALRSLRVGGRIVVVGNIAEEKVALNLGYVITFGLSIIGGSGATRKEMADVVAMHGERPFAHMVDRTLPLSRAEEAQQLVRAGGLHGRVVLVTE
jgi:D-arabinose 1-dehydrogenase-like Zn-dependent alcohol dehydrogenase